MGPPVDGATRGALPRGTICRAGGSDEVVPSAIISTFMDPVAVVSSAWTTSALAFSMASPEDREEPAISEVTTVALTPTARGRTGDSTTVA